MTLEVSNLSAHYGRLEVCRAIGFDVRPGEVLLLLGPNGAGKSTTLSAIAGTVSSAGAVLVNGVDVSRRTAHRRARMGLALVPEGRRNMIGQLSVQDNLLLGLSGLIRADRDARMTELLDKFPSLAARLRQPASMLSGGEQQMLAIGIALARGPSVLLLDEPTQGLAPVILDQLVELIADLTRSGLAVLLAEQNVSFARRVSDRFCVLDQGEITHRGDRGGLMEETVAAMAMLGG